MSNAAKLKKKAVELEQKKQYDKALALYVQVLDESVAADEEPEVALYNRVGDLLLRVGNVDEAIRYYGKAVDLYAEGGFLNNAIALCNKILRHDPSQTAVHYTLGRISARKGFRSDAKHHFLEYAERMQRAGEIDESFRALKEFADLCPDQDDIRLMLAEQLTKHERGGEAIEQLQILHERLLAEGRTSEARAAVERMIAIDPAAAPRAGGASPTPKKDGGLVFLDVSWDTQRPGRSAADVPAAPEAPAALPVVEATFPSNDSATGNDREVAVQTILDDDSGSVDGDSTDAPPAPVAGFETTVLDAPEVDAPGLVLDPEVESPSIDVEAPASVNDEFGLRDLAGAPAPMDPPSLLDLDVPSDESSDVDDLPTVLPLVFLDVDDEAPESAGPELTLIMPDAIDAERPSGSAHGGYGADGGGGADAESEFVNLGDWLRDDEPPKSTRMVTDAVEPGEGEEFDFDDMLRKFKRGVAENVDEDDHESHYDLGVAFREMGLVDEAIAEFQKALRASGHRGRTYEALGQCFVDKSQFQVAASVLTRAVTEAPDDDNHLVGVLYLLGTANEALGRHDDAIAFYQRVFAVDIEFRDVEDRLSTLERTAR